MASTRPDRIFVSVDQSTGKSTISFQPAEAGTPVQLEGDQTGANAMREAKAIADKNPGCTIHGPHFHAARPTGRWKVRKRPVRAAGEGGGE